MANNVVPVDEMDKIGLFTDSPALKVPLNGFTDMNNIRLRHMAVRKIEGEEELTGFTLPSGHEYVYAAPWANPNLAPNNLYYVIVTRSTDSDHIHLLNVGTGVDTEVGTTSNNTGKWQHTLFSAGFAFILNNGLETPFYMLDEGGNTNITSISLDKLPGWESYNSQPPIVDTTYSDTASEYSLGFLVNYSTSTVEVRVIDTDGVDTESQSFTSNGTKGNVTVSTDSTSNTTQVTFAADAVPDGYSVNISYRSTSTVTVTAGVIRAFGDLLVAGDLEERVGTSVFRKLAGVVRTSDVAPAGTIPANWNPFFIGAGTADEFLLSTSGIVQDMAVLQGRLAIYTNNSIHYLVPTGNAQVPFASQEITSTYGAMTTGSVLEFDGQHVVVGTNDIYLFTGHPGNIQSIADGRVRDYFYENLDQENYENIILFRNQPHEELWFCYPKVGDTEATEALIWSYRGNVWSKRSVPEIRSGHMAPVVGAGSSDPNRPWDTDEVDFNITFPLLARSGHLMAADLSYTDYKDSDYVSYFENVLTPMAPEFNTETIVGLALHCEGSTKLKVFAGSNNLPADTIDTTTLKEYSFDMTKQYKTDMRFNGRFINYRIEDNTDTGWSISGMQLEIMAGGTR